MTSASLVLLLIALLVLSIVLGAMLVLYRDRAARLERLQAIRSYVFAASLLRKLQDAHPQLQEKDTFLVARALREFFLIHAQLGQGPLVGMPSKVVDDLWHEFILDTRAYAAFCERAFGHFFHHVPASSTAAGTDINASLRLTWVQACREENINPDRPLRLPLLFAIDAKLDITGGHHYTLRSMARPAGDNASSGCAGVACGGGSAACGDGGGSSCGGGGDGGGVCGGGCGGS